MNKNEKINKTLPELKVGSSGKVLKICPECLGKKKFADMGIIAGTELILEAQAPFGGLLRVRVLDSSISLHKNDAKHIIIEG